MSFHRPRAAVQVTMQPLLQGEPPGDSTLQAARTETAAASPWPRRWQTAVENIEQLVANLDQLARTLDGALYLDDDEWQKSLPVHKYTMAIQVQHQRIGDLEQQLAGLRAWLAESERGRASAEAHTRELEEELERNARVFQLHYDELMRKEKEIAELQATISALSLGGGGGAGAGAASSPGGGSFGGGPGSSGGDEAATELRLLRP